MKQAVLGIMVFVGAICSASAWDGQISQIFPGPFKYDPSNLLVNSNWIGGTTAPTSWSVVLGTSTSLPSRFYGGKALARSFVASGDRQMISQITPSLAANGLYTLTATVEQNTTGIVLNQIFAVSASPSGEVTTYPSGGGLKPVPGQRITMLITMGGTPGTVTIRMGAGTGGNVTGTIVLSNPQLVPYYPAR